jgi:transposase
LCDELSALAGEANEVSVAIERPDGAVVETLMERGFTVHAINPLQLDRFRERYRPSGAKDDRVDAWVLARTVLSDADCFRRIEFGDARCVALREWSRMRSKWTNERTRLLNQLTDVLRRYYPQILDVGDVDDGWVHTLLRKASTPDAAQGVERRAVQTLLDKHRVRKVTADHVVATLRSRALTLNAELVTVLAAHALQLVTQLDNNQQHIDECDAAIKNLLASLATSEDPEAEPSDAAIVRSIPGVGPVIASTMLGEAAAAIVARDLQRMRAITGCAPVSVLSGKRQNRYHPRSAANVQMRYSRSNRLADAAYHMARIASIYSEPHKARYKAMRSRGHTHGRACRQLADQMLTTLFAMLRDRTLYDETKITKKAA